MGFWEEARGLQERIRDDRNEFDRVEGLEAIDGGEWGIGITAKLNGIPQTPNSVYRIKVMFAVPAFPEHVGGGMFINPTGAYILAAHIGNHVVANGREIVYWRFRDRYVFRD